MIWSKLTFALLCCSAVRRQLRCILWLGTMWQCWTARILPMLSTGRWQILMLLIQGTTLLRNVSCSYAGRVLAFTRFVDLLVEQCNYNCCDQSKEICWSPCAILILCCCCLNMILVLHLNICCMVQVVEHWMFY